MGGDIVIQSTCNSFRKKERKLFNMSEPNDLTLEQRNQIKIIVQEVLEEKLRDLATKADLEELAKDDDIGAIVKVLEHHNLIVKAD